MGFNSEFKGLIKYSWASSRVGWSKNRRFGNICVLAIRLASQPRDAATSSRLFYWTNAERHNAFISSLLSLRPIHCSQQTFPRTPVSVSIGKITDFFGRTVQNETVTFSTVHRYTHKTGMRLSHSALCTHTHTKQE